MSYEISSWKNFLFATFEKEDHRIRDWWKSNASRLNKCMKSTKAFGVQLFIHTIIVLFSQMFMHVFSYNVLWKTKLQQEEVANWDPVSYIKWYLWIKMKSKKWFPLFWGRKPLLTKNWRKNEPSVLGFSKWLILMQIAQLGPVQTSWDISVQLINPT